MAVINPIKTKSEKKNNPSGRPESWNADYFPHHTEVPMELKFLEHVYGAEGYRAYYRIQEQLSKADYHFINLENDYDMLTFKLNCNVPGEILSEVLKYLVDREILDREMYEQNKLWMPSLVNKLKPLYANRRKDPPRKVGTEIVSTCRNTQYSKVKKRKEKKRKDSSITTIDDLKIKFSEIDVDKSLDKLKKHNDEFELSDAIKWLNKDLTEGWNKKQEKFKKTINGDIIAYCSKCGKKDILGAIKGAYQLSSCCNADYQKSKK